MRKCFSQFPFEEGNAFFVVTQITTLVTISKYSENRLRPFIKIAGMYWKLASVWPDNMTKCVFMILFMKLSVDISLYFPGLHLTYVIFNNLSICLQVLQIISFSVVNMTEKLRCCQPDLWRVFLTKHGKDLFEGILKRRKK